MSQGRNPQQPRDFNSLPEQQKDCCGKLLSDELLDMLLRLFKSSDRRIRMCIIACLMLIMANSVSMPYLGLETRLRTFIAYQDTDSVGRWALNGFHSDGAGGAVCFNCGARVSEQQMSTGEPDQSRSNHGPCLAGTCAFRRLLRLLLFRGSLPLAEIAAGADESERLIKRLQDALNHPTVRFAMSFGFSENDMALVLLRHGFITGQSVIGQRPGDLIRLIHEQNELMSADRLPWSISELLQVAIEDHRRQVKDNTPRPMESQGNELGPTQQHQQRRQDRSSPAAKQQRPPTGQPRSVDAGLDTQPAQQPVDSPAAPQPDSRLCIVCQQRARNRVTLPCAHFVSCNVCLESRVQCPSCGGSILASLNAFTM